MQDKWLSYQRFQYNQDVLASINTVLINIKLAECRAMKPKKKRELLEAEEKLVGFLRQLDATIQKCALGQPILGANIRLRQITESFVRSEGSRPAEAEQPVRPDRLLQLIEAGDSSDKITLITGLSDLRRILERHIQTDAVQVLGEH